MKFKALALAILLPLSAIGQNAPAEIEQLFKVLETSGCTFNRNGSWYSAAKAGEHLRRKYDYLAKKGTIPSTESFIDLAASTSSVSGKPYLVRCGGSAPVQSKAWFSAKLQGIRGAAGQR